MSFDTNNINEGDLLKLEILESNNSFYTYKKGEEIYCEVIQKSDFIFKIKDLKSNNIQVYMNSNFWVSKNIFEYQNNFMKLRIKFHKISTNQLPMFLKIKYEFKRYFKTIIRDFNFTRR